MIADRILLIAGLGNPGNRYNQTRHNVGFWFIERLQREYKINFSLENKFKAETGTFTYANHQIRVIAPNTYMNHSGDSIASMAAFYRIDPSQILIVHDELDLAPGLARLKIAGGHGGHNGLRDIVSKLGSPNFMRLRIGIGHPGVNQDVSGYVLNKPSREQQILIENAIDTVVDVFPDIIEGNYGRAMKSLHTDSVQPIDHGN